MLIVSGIIVMSAAIISGIVAAILMRAQKRRLEQQFELEYGKRRHS